MPFSTVTRCARGRQRARLHRRRMRPATRKAVCAPSARRRCSAASVCSRRPEQFRTHRARFPPRWPLTAPRHEAEQTAQQAKTRYDALAQALGEIPELPAPARDVSGLTTEQAQAALARTQALAAAVQSQLDQSRGRLEQFGSEAELSAKKAGAGAEARHAERAPRGAYACRQTLAQANAALAERFSPRLVREASEIFSELTGGRYARVQISRQMELEAGQPDAAMRRSLFLSGGTADELYLSVRLAVCRLLLPEDAPAPAG